MHSVADEGRVINGWMSALGGQRKKRGIEEIETDVAGCGSLTGEARSLTDGYGWAPPSDGR